MRKEEKCKEALLLQKKLKPDYNLFYLHTKWLTQDIQYLKKKITSVYK